MLTAVFQSMPPKLGVSFPHTQAEEIQSISLEVVESDPLHDFLQAVYIGGSRMKKLELPSLYEGHIIHLHETDTSSRYRRIFVFNKCICLINVCGTVSDGVTKTFILVVNIEKAQHNYCPKEFEFDVLNTFCVKTCGSKQFPALSKTQILIGHYCHSL